MKGALMKKPRFGSAIFCNGVTPGEDGKLNCSDVFTSFLSWGKPSSIRNWFAVFNMYDLPIGTTSVVISIVRGFSGRGEKTTLSAIDVHHKGQNLGSVFHAPLFYQFQKPGDYSIIFQITGSNTKLIVPIKVTEQDWPKFTKKDIQIIRDNPQIPKKIRSVINCSDCSRPYTFEESFVPEIPVTEGTQAFPEDGIFECDTCGRIIHLKDIQGQVRNSIRRALDRLKKGN
jgi:hypothetical protein